ncbi:hypothetical protein ACF064_35630 [Streptomyces sp. NPDC015492]|uniref:hypothetical protein n=1 Tax=Streptomyces sp. NPDC015492 TaxID=3364958 RepID=UPI0036F9635B
MPAAIAVVKHLESLRSSPRHPCKPISPTRMPSAARLARRVQLLELRLSQELGRQGWHESGLGASADVSALQVTVERLEQQVVELTRQLEENQGDLEAARSANRELTRALNQRDDLPSVTEFRPR